MYRRPISRPKKAADSALKWVDEQMTTADLVAVASIGSSLQILSDFTSDKDQVRDALAAFTSGGNSTVAAPVDASTAATDEAANAATDDTTTTDASAQELDPTRAALTPETHSLVRHFDGAKTRFEFALNRAVGGDSTDGRERGIIVVAVQVE